MNIDRMAVQNSIFYWMQRTVKEKGCIATTGQVAIGSTRGIVRQDNQDRAAVVTFYPSDKLSETVNVAVLCDGIGGLQDGANAAALAISAFVSQLVGLSDDNLKGQLSFAANKANGEVFAKYKGRGGCTLSAVSITKAGPVEIVNYGDSRVYLQNGNGLVQLSTDDTLDGQLAKMDRHVGVSLPEFKHLVQFIGMEGEIDTSSIDINKIKDGDQILIVSDGVYGVEFQFMEKILLNSNSAESSIKKLLLLSEWVGGVDNATAIILPAFSFIDEYESIPHGMFEITTWSSGCFFSIVEMNKQHFVSTPNVYVAADLHNPADKMKMSQKAKRKRITKNKQKLSGPEEQTKSKGEVSQLKIEFNDGEVD
ncbi:putative Protein phosphatase [uncultured Desulfovibrio sp.]|uniref:PPM-type phosphatase domain-containing protein n=1 Tax=uncultured Desulfovibrio sp. TaxID=167968 RepID=A0A212J745_9BACT|nr:hypothetical protein [uncultured Desulfovibrio sp.]SBV95246.1 putative Protein phosphatase [uncultured Desulfovibrio sp.]